MWLGCFDSLQKRVHRGRKVAFKKESLPCNRVDKTKGFRVKGLSRNEGEEVMHFLFLTRRSGAGNNAATAIRWISEHRMSDVRQVNSDLVSSTREELQTYMSEPGKLLFHGIGRDGVLPSRYYGDLFSV